MSVTEPKKKGREPDKWSDKRSAPETWRPLRGHLGRRGGLTQQKVRSLLRWRSDCSRCEPMARAARRHLVELGSVNHCTWRSHNFSHVLGTDAAKAFFLKLLADHKKEHGIEILSYSVMNTHPHVQLRSTRGQLAFSKFWRVVNYRFARWSNRRNGKRGQVVMERMASPQVQEGIHQLAVMRYGDMNPVRAGLVRSPKEWAWSSYRHYAFGETNDLITDAPEYLALGATGPERRRAYVHLFALRHSMPFRWRRKDLVTVAFIGDCVWALSKSRAHGLSPPLVC